MSRNAGPKARAAPTRSARKLYARLGLTPEARDQDVEAAHRELVKFLEGAPDGVRGWAESEIAAADEAYARLSDPARATTGRRPLVKRMGVGIVALGAAVGIAVAVYNMGDGQSEPEPPEAETTQAPRLTAADQARVARLMEKVKTKPRDVSSLVRLGNIFFRVSDYEAAGSWMARAVKVEPRNTTARLALGAAQFNLGGVADARRQWLRVIAIDPENVEAYYDLGFLYLSKNPPEVAKARRAWRKVVEIAPRSSAARTVATHLKRYDDAQAQGGPDSAAAPPLGSER